MPPRGRRPSRLAERRKTLGYSQEKLAEKLGVDRSTVARWERGETKDPQPEIRPLIAQALRISLEELSALLPPEGSFEDEPLPPSLPDVTDDLSHEPVDERYLAGSKEKIGQLLAMERTFGGERISALAMDAAESMDRKLLTAGTRRGLERDAFAVAAELFEVSGWFLVDAAKHDEVRRANQRAIQYCSLAGDRSMEVFVIQNMSMHATEIGNHGEGLTLARGVLDRDLSPRVAALFHMREARALAHRGESEARQSSARAMAEFYDGVRQSDPDWSWWVDEAQLRWHEGWVFGHLGEWGKAIDIFSNGLDGTQSLFDPINYLGLATMGYAQANAHAWGDLDVTMLRLASGMEEIRSSRTKKRIVLMVGQILRSSGVPESTREVAHTLRTHPNLR